MDSISLLDRVLTRLSLTADDKLTEFADQFLVAIVHKLSDPSVEARKKVNRILNKIKCLQVSFHRVFGMMESVCYFPRVVFSLATYSSLQPFIFIFSLSLSLLFFFSSSKIHSNLGFGENGKMESPSNTHSALFFFFFFFLSIYHLLDYISPAQILWRMAIHHRSHFSFSLVLLTLLLLQLL
jgi:hypothetical protein